MAGPRIDYQAKWPLAVDQHRRPDAADVIAIGGGDELRLGRFDDDVSDWAVGLGRGG
jgi:hypothetical protein